MTSAPLVSIVLPIFNDEATVSAALESCLAQTMAEIEVICVDDGSTDRTAALIESFRARDARIRLISHERTLSAFQARRTGILAASAAHVLFLDGDDELTADAAEKALAAAHATGADLLGFGVTVVETDGRTGSPFEQRLQPAHRQLDGVEVLRGLFPIGTPGRGQLWRYLFRTELLREAYALLPSDIVLPRINDLPLMFLVATLAERYASIDDRLYRYHFGRGGSGHRVDSVERAVFYTSAIRSVDIIRPAVESVSRTHPEGSLVLASYESMRLSIIGYVCFQLIQQSDSTVLVAALAHLHASASTPDILRAAAQFYPATLSVLKFHTPWLGAPDRPVRSVMLATSTLRTGGISAVTASQARYLSEAGFRVTIVARNGGSDRKAIPSGATFLELRGRDLEEKLTEWAEICRTHEIDTVIDHQVLYMDPWPEYALAARAAGAATIGWLHNFVGRSVYDGNGRLSLIERCSGTLSQLVVLSPLDVAYFKLRGIRHTSYVPNPPSPIFAQAAERPVEKTPPQDRMTLIWWGRLEQRTKQIRDLIEVGVQLRRLDVDFELKVIGPDWDDVTAAKFNREARRRGVSDRVAAVGPLHGTALIDAIDRADAFVSTSVVEGYQLTIAEAQSRGVPVVMYELPWLVLVQGNEGIVSVRQGDAVGLAHEVARLLEDPERYRRLSRASIEAAARARDYDFSELYRGVVTDTLPPEFSPEPTLADAEQLLGLIVFFADRAQRRGIAPRVEAGAVSRLWESAAPLGRRMLKELPSLGPLSHRVKGWLHLR